MGTPSIASATSTCRWCGVSASPMEAEISRRSSGSLGVRRGTRRVVGEPGPAIGVEHHLALLPGALAQPYGGLEQRELVRPGGEATDSAKLVELGQHGHDGIIGRLHRDVIEVLTAHVDDTRAAARDLEPSGAQQQLMEALDRLVVDRPARSERVQPGTGTARLGQSSGSCRRGRPHARSPSDGISAGAAHGSGCSRSSGARIRTARCGGQPRSTSSSSAWRSNDMSRAS